MDFPPRGDIVVSAGKYGVAGLVKWSRHPPSQEGCRLSPLGDDGGDLGTRPAVAWVSRGRCLAVPPSGQSVGDGGHAGFAGVPAPRADSGAPPHAVGTAEIEVPREPRVEVFFFCFFP